MLRVDGLTYEDVLEYDFGSVLKEHKILGFKGVYLTPKQQFFVCKKLYEHGCCISLHANSKPVSVFTGTDGAHLAGRYLAPENTDPEATILQNWHTDNSDDLWVTAYITLSMTHFEEMDDSWGNTIFVDLEDLYEKCPFKEQLATAYVQNFPHGAVHRALRTHPVTGKTALLYSDPRQVLVGKEHFWETNHGKEREPIDDPQEDWFNDYKEWVATELAKETNRLRWVYDEGDFVIFDNRCVGHTFSVFEKGKRSFNRGLAGNEMIWHGEKPAYAQEAENNIPPLPEVPFEQCVHDAVPFIEQGN